MAKMKKRAVDRVPFPTPVPGSRDKPPADPKDPLRIKDIGTMRSSGAYQREAQRAGLENPVAFRNAAVSRVPTGFQPVASLFYNDFTLGNPNPGQVVVGEVGNKPKTTMSRYQIDAQRGRGAPKKSADSTMKKRNRDIPRFIPPSKDDLDAMRESAPAAPMPKQPRGRLGGVVKGQGAYTEHMMTKGKKKGKKDEHIIDPNLREEMHAVMDKGVAMKKQSPNDDRRSNVGAAPPGWFSPGGRGNRPQPKPIKPKPIPVPKPIPGVKPPPIYGDVFPNRPTKMSKRGDMNPVTGVITKPKPKPIPLPKPIRQPRPEEQQTRPEIPNKRIGINPPRISRRPPRDLVTGMNKRKRGS